jgi:hypothetical protein
MTAIALARGRTGFRVPALGFRRWHLVPLLAYVVYLGAGAYLAFALHAYHGDAYSRVSNASYVLFSRDPHLAAMGFVWMPLPSAFELVLLPARSLFPALTEQGFAAVIMSATFMALAVATLDRILVDFGIRGFVRAGLVAAFALHPMILYYGAIGTSEAPTVFFALLAVRYLARYCVDASTASLVGLGIALAGGYLTRYEAAAAPVGVAGLILVLSLARVPGTIRVRALHAASDIAVAVTPFVLVFVAWAVASWLIVGSPFSQFSSDYGNSTQMRVWAAQGANEIGLPLGPSVTLAGLRLLALSIAAPVGLLAAAWLFLARRDWRVLAIGAVLGPMLGFMVLAYVLHLVAPWLRYFILVVPLGILLVALAIAPRSSSDAAEGPKPARSLRGLRVSIARAASPLAAALLLAVALVNVPVSAVGMLNRSVAVEEAKDLGGLLGPEAALPHRPGAALRTFAGEQAVADYLDAMDLPRGSVLLDVFSGFPIVMLSAHPDRFVITPDRDFERVLADPAIFGVSHILVPSINGNGIMDAVNRAYPNLDIREDYATEVRTFPAVGTSATWTLYRLVTEGS